MHNKKKRTRKTCEILLFAVEILGILISLSAFGVLCWSWYGSQQSKNTFIDLQNQYTIPIPELKEKKEINSNRTWNLKEERTSSKGENWASSLLQINFIDLQHDWPDVVAWIQWPLMNINFPILHGDTNDMYLRSLPDGTWNEGGSIFLESRNHGMNDLHTIVYGHNMDNGSMFGQLKNYLNEEFFVENGKEASFILYTPEGAWKYNVFSIEKVLNTDPDVYMVGYVPGDEYTNWVKQLQESSLYDMGISVDGTQPVITLSTCDSIGASQGSRLVLHAVRGNQLL